MFKTRKSYKNPIVSNQSGVCPRLALSDDDQYFVCASNDNAHRAEEHGEWAWGLQKENIRFDLQDLQASAHPFTFSFLIFPIMDSREQGTHFYEFLAVPEDDRTKFSTCSKSLESTKHEWNASLREVQMIISDHLETDVPPFSLCAWMIFWFWSFFWLPLLLLRNIGIPSRWFNIKKMFSQCRIRVQKMEICNLFQMINHRGKGKFNLIISCIHESFFDLESLLSANDRKIYEKSCFS